MCITRTVGRYGRNDNADVRIVQLLFNMNRPRFAAGAPEALKADGQIGPKTIAAIEYLENVWLSGQGSDGLVAPGDATVRALLAALPAGPSEDKLSLVLPRAMPQRISLFYPGLLDAMQRYGITSPLQIAHFIAQLGHESASFLYTEELADGRAYEGRKDLGNVVDGDGPRYKGRGLIQLTGRANYAAYGAYCDKDYLSHPEVLAQDPAVAVDVACWFWKTRGLGPLADADDAKAVTRRINGGYNGLDDRLEYLGRAKALLGL